MDTPNQASGALDANQAASELAKFFDSPEEKTTEEAETPAEPQAEAEKPDDTPPETEQTDEEPKRFTIKVDGKDVEVTESELAEYYKSGLRQADYTKKTMEAAEQRKAATEAIQRAQVERQQYAQGLAQAQALLTAQLQEQSQVNWQQLLESDPVKYLKQQHLAQTRQAQLQQVVQQQQVLAQRTQEESAALQRSFLQQQQQELLAKLPEWKDEKRASSEREALKSYLKDTGLEDSEINNITDHRLVVLARKAWMYDQTMGKASVAAKKVSNLPQKVERPGVQTADKGLDRRQAAYQRLSKSGRVEDAASLLANFV